MSGERFSTERGAQLRDEGRHDEAIPVLRRAVALGEPDAPRLLALALIEVDDRPAARQVLTDAVDGGRVDLAGLLGDVADELDDVELAERAYRLAVDSGDPAARNDFGVFLSGQGRTDEAIAVFRQAIDDGDDLAAANLVLTYAEDLDDLTTATELGEQYLDTGKPKTVTALARVYELSDRLDDAEVFYRRGVEVGAPQAHVRLGQFLRDSRLDLAGAEREFRSAWEDDEADWGHELGSLLHQAGRADEAVEVLRHAAGWGDQDARALLDEITGSGPG